MWTSKQPQTNSPAMPTPQEPGPPIKPSNATPPTRSGSPTARDVACLGSSLVIKGDISGREDLQMDATVEGAIALQSHRLTVGHAAHLHSEIFARELVVYGKVEGNLRVRDRVEIKRDGSVIGDITTARISIEDGAYFKGRIEIDSGNRPVTEDADRVGVPATTSAI